MPGLVRTQSAGVLALTSNRDVALVSTGGSAGYIAAQANGQFAVVNPSDPLRARAVGQQPPKVIAPFLSPRNGDTRANQ